MAGRRGRPGGSARRSRGGLDLTSPRLGVASGPGHRALPLNGDSAFGRGELALSTAFRGIDVAVSRAQDSRSFGFLTLLTFLLLKQVL